MPYNQKSRDPESRHFFGAVAIYGFVMMLAGLALSAGILWGIITIVNYITGN